jgi:hypothetical protein
MVHKLGLLTEWTYEDVPVQAHAGVAGSRPVTKNQRLGKTYTAGNIEAARIIAVDPDRYPGLLQEWARRVLSPSVRSTEPAIRRVA